MLDNGSPKWIKLLPLSAVVISFVFGYGVLNATIAAQGDKIKDNKTAIESLSRGQAQIREGQARIDERTKRTGKDVEEIKRLLLESLKDRN